VRSLFHGSPLSLIHNFGPTLGCKIVVSTFASAKA
jgi:hypothetical protein